MAKALALLLRLNLKGEDVRYLAARIEYARKAEIMPRAKTMKRKP